jgi:glyoxylase-like metal-dependent hydrolase (beta-lactamase superfamily II)
MEVVPGLHWVEQIWDTKVYLLLVRDRVVVIDAATPGRAGAVWRYVYSLGYAPEAVSEIWLTHGDIDHMGSLAALKARSGAWVVVHRADAPLVNGQADRELGQGPGTDPVGRLARWSIHRLLRCALRPVAVDRLLEDGDNLEGWQVVHVPGHTAGSVCFYHPRLKVAIVGDALNYRRGRLGAPPSMFTVDMIQAHASIQKIATLDFEVCCFGHGPPLMRSARQQVQAFAGSLSL